AARLACVNRDPPQLPTLSGGATLESIKVTLYDIFGYLLPGGFLLAALGIVYWAVFHSGTALTLVELPTQLLVIVLALGYVSGHVLQGVCTGSEWVWRKVKRQSEEVFPAPDSRIVEAARRKLARLISYEVSWSRALFDLCDEFVTQRGVRESQELFEYRRG